MHTQEIQQQFFNVLKQSQAFKALTLQEQNDLLVAYENAEDKVLQNALQILNSVELKLQEKLKKIDENQIRVAQEIKTTLEQLAKQELTDNAAKDKEDSEKALADLSKIIDSL